MRNGKFAKALVLAAAFFGGISTYLPGVSSAEDVWCCASEGLSYYLDSESINADNLPKGMDYRAAVKAVRQSGKLDSVITYGFEAMNDTLVGYFFDASSKNWMYAGELRDKPDLSAVWASMKPYMKQKGIPYSDAWK